MALLKSYIHATGFVVDGHGGHPVGTAFCIRAIDVSDEDAAFPYVVTCRHVIQSCWDTPYLRMRVRPKSVVDVPLGPSFQHPEYPEIADVSLHHFTIPEPDLGYIFRAIPMGYDGRRKRPTYPPWFLPEAVGQDVFYAGYLEPVPSMGERMVPMVRGAKLGAWNQEDVPFEIETGDRSVQIGIRAHLIDANAYHGFSGSPCYVEHHLMEHPPDFSPSRRHVLIGMLAGFFKWNVGQGRFPVNSGTGIVIPNDTIVETLCQEQLMEDRKKRRKRLQSRP